MKLIPFESLPSVMKTQEVKKYYDRLKKKSIYLSLKRGFDVLASAGLIILLSLPMLIIAYKIKKDSPGPVIFKQTRVTQPAIFLLYMYHQDPNSCPEAFLRLYT